MAIPYRTRSFLKRLGISVLILSVISAVVLICCFIWLDRYVIYTRDGVSLDFSSSSQSLSGQVPAPPVIENPISVYYYDGNETFHAQKELSQINGYYITTEDLETDFQAVLDQVKRIPAESAVMLDVKSIYGSFFYSSNISENRNADVDTAAMDALIKQLCSSNYYTIARVPALRDRMYGLENVNDGLPVAAGYLWIDDQGCYWLNPSRDGTITYLAQIANELKNLGFDEVVFCDYYIPDDEDIVYTNDKSQALAHAAQTLVNSCSGESFTVSFAVQAEFAAPDGRSRMYLENVTAADAAAEADKFGFENSAARILFLADNHDTRFDAYSVLRPISTVE